MTVFICCEGAGPCNAGRSALVRKAAAIAQVPNVTAEMRDEAEKHARGQVSRQLATTPHRFDQIDRRHGIAYALWRCEVCGHTRVYGNSVTWEP